VTPAGVTQLGYVRLGVSDAPAWIELATGVLGMAVNSGSGGGTTELRLDDHSYRIILDPTGVDDLECVGWQVAGPDALAQIEERLARAGISVEPGAAELAERRRVGGMVAFRDPSGLLLEVYWGPEMVVGPPFVPGRPCGGFKAGALGLGHVVLAVDDVSATKEFYIDVLGFRLSDHGNGPFCFLRCNPRHHSIAFGPAAAVRSDKRLLHFMVEMNDLDDVGIAHDLCEQRQIPIAITLGRHTNDRMFSFYARTPSGFRVECGHGGLLVDDEWQVRRYRDREVWGHRRVEETLLDASRPAVAAQDHTS
jgi:extradiol dioxygenase